MVDLKMDGIRNWKFDVTGTGILQLIDTDFWIDYNAAVQGTGQAELSLTLTNVWQHSDFDLAKGLARRSFIEDRLKELKWDFVGKKGTLTIDESTPQQKVLNDITLIDVVTEVGDFNELIEYSLNFAFPLASSSGFGGVEIARKLSFLKWPHNFFVKTEKIGTSPWGLIQTAILTADDAIAPDGTLTADKIDDQSGAFFSTALLNQNIVDDSELYEIGVHIKRVASPGQFSGIRAKLEGGTAVETFYTIDHDTGALLLRTGKVAAQEAKITRRNKDWWRVSLRLQNNGTGNDEAEVELFPAVASTFVASWLQTITGFQHYWGAHCSRTLAARGSPVPYISADATPTDTAALTQNAENYVVERSRRDRTVFKDVFRAAPIRVRSEAGLDTVRITGIKQLTVAAQSTLLQRQEAEGIVKNWIDKVGLDGILRIDFQDTAEQALVAHLVSSSPGTLGLQLRVQRGIHRIVWSQHSRRSKV